MPVKIFNKKKQKAKLRGDTLLLAAPRGRTVFREKRVTKELEKDKS